MDPFSWRLHVFSINLLTPKCFVRGRCLRCVWNKTSVKRSTFYCKEILFPLSPYRKYYRRIIKLTMWKLLKCPPSSTTLYSNTCLLSRGKTNAFRKHFLKGFFKRWKSCERKASIHKWRWREGSACALRKAITDVEKSVENDFGDLLQ